VLDEARLLAAQVDNHIGNLENLLLGMSQAVSPRLADTNANDALLRQIKKDLPDYIANILLFAPDGSNIGSSLDADVKRFYAGDRSYFQQVMAGQHLAIGNVIRTKLTGEWVVAVASPVKDQTGRLRAVIAVGTKLAGGSVVRVINQDALLSHKATTVRIGSAAISATQKTSLRRWRQRNRPPSRYGPITSNV
jgi:hypothetical protein